MANIALKTANRVEIVESLQQMTLVAAEAIVPGAPVRLDTSTGKFTNANGTSTGEARVWGIAVGQKAILAGTPCTAIRRGVLDGYTFSQAYDAAIYLSDTDGTLADAAGTVSTVVGRVIPGTAVTLGTSPDKLLSIEL
jgi:hypothetical protein